VALSGLVRSGDREAEERRAGAWRDRLTARQVVQVEKIAGTELTRLGYALSADG
jgi:hypothetical protein